MIDINFTDFSGGFKGGVVPARVVAMGRHAASLTGWQLGWASAHYEDFCRQKFLAAFSGIHQTEVILADGAKVLIVSEQGLDTIYIWPVRLSTEGGFYGGITLQLEKVVKYPSGLMAPVAWGSADDPPELMDEATDATLPGNAPGVSRRFAESAISPNGLIVQIDPNATLDEDSFGAGAIRFFRGPTDTGGVIDLHLEKERYLLSASENTFYLCGREIPDIPEVPSIDGYTTYGASWVFSFGFDVAFDWEYPRLTGRIFVGANYTQSWPNDGRKHVVYVLDVAPNDEGTALAFVGWTELVRDEADVAPSGYPFLRKQVLGEVVQHIVEYRNTTDGGAYLLTISGAEGKYGNISAELQLVPDADQPTTELTGTHSLTQTVTEIPTPNTRSVKATQFEMVREFVGPGEMFGWRQTDQVVTTVNALGPVNATYQWAPYPFDPPGSAFVVRYGDFVNFDGTGEANAAALAEFDTVYGARPVTDILGVIVGDFVITYGATGRTTATITKYFYSFEFTQTVEVWGQGWSATRTSSYDGGTEAPAPTFERVVESYDVGEQELEVSYGDGHTFLADMKFRTAAPVSLSTTGVSTNLVGTLNRGAVYLPVSITVPGSSPHIISDNLFAECDATVFGIGASAKTVDVKGVRLNFSKPAPEGLWSYDVGAGTGTATSFDVGGWAPFARDDDGSVPVWGSSGVPYGEVTSLSRTWNYEGSAAGRLSTADLGGTTGRPDYFFQRPDDSYVSEFFMTVGTSFAPTYTGPLGKLPFDEFDQDPLPAAQEDYSRLIYDGRNDTYVAQVSMTFNATTQSRTVYNELWVGNKNGCTKLLPLLNAWIASIDPDSPTEYTNADLLAMFNFAPMRLI